jgi:hypothetical protein
MTKVMASFSCTALHRAWIEYIAEPSPTSAITRAEGRARATPTAAGRPKPRPPLAIV